MIDIQHSSDDVDLLSRLDALLEREQYKLMDDYRDQVIEINHYIEISRCKSNKWTLCQINVEPKEYAFSQSFKAEPW